MKNIITLLRSVLLIVTLSAMSIIPNDIEYYGMTNTGVIVAFVKALTQSNFAIDNFYLPIGKKLLVMIVEKLRRIAK